MSNTSTLPPASMLPICTACERTFAHALPRCTACSSARYCSTDCQMQDYPFHKHICSHLEHTRTRWVSTSRQGAASVVVPFVVSDPRTQTLSLHNALLAMKLVETCCAPNSGTVLVRSGNSAKIMMCRMMKICSTDSAYLALYVFYANGLQDLHVLRPSASTTLSEGPHSAINDIRQGTMSVKAVLDTTERVYQNLNATLRISRCLESMLGDCAPQDGSHNERKQNCDSEVDSL